MDLKFENIRSFVLHTFHFICISNDTYTFFMDFLFENIPSFVLYTFHLMYLAQGSSKLSMFCPPRYLYFFHGLEI